MGLIDNVLGSIGYTRMSDGSHWYTKKGTANFLNGKDALQVALNNPVVSTCLNIRASLLSKAVFYQLDSEGEKVYTSTYLDLINNPNTTQSKEDFLKQFEWYKSSFGWVYQKPYGSSGFNPSSVYNLRPSYIEFPNQPLSSIVWKSSDIKAYQQQEFVYKEPNQKTRNIKYEDVLMFFDIANGLGCNDSNDVTSPSRLTSNIKSISNIGLALEAENVIIQTNGREIFSSNASGSNSGGMLGMEKNDKQSIENKLINKYRVGFNGVRSIATNRPIEWQPIHIKLEDLGLKDSLNVNADLIRSGFQVPSELFDAFGDNKTFENQKEALLGMYQNTIQPLADDFANTWNHHFKLEGLDTIYATYEHLPIMQHTEQMKADKVLKIAMAYEKLLNTGMSVDSIADLFQNQGLNIEL